MVKTAVLAPIPRARERMATAAKTGDLASDRRAYRNSPDKFIDTPNGYLQANTRRMRVCSRILWDPRFPRAAITRGLVGRTPWSAADAPVGLLAPCKMLTPLSRQRDEGVQIGRASGRESV